MEISFIAFLLSSDIVWHSNLSIKCPASLDDDFLQDFDGEVSSSSLHSHLPICLQKYDFCPQAKEMDPSKYLVLIATDDAVRAFHNWVCFFFQSFFDLLVRSRAMAESSVQLISIVKLEEQISTPIDTSWLITIRSKPKTKRKRALQLDRDVWDNSLEAGMATR